MISYENEVIVVLTENKYLFSGIASLLKESKCLLMHFKECEISEQVKKAKNITIVVDCLIVFQGEWGAFSTLLGFCPCATVVWLARSETGRIFPTGREGDCILEQKVNLAFLRHTLRNPSTLQHKKNIPERVQIINFTKKERKLLRSFIHGVAVPDLSKRTGTPIKQLYRFRKNIILKTGFRTINFLQLAYKRNNGLPGF